jgi:hypothetical protein
LGSVTFLRKVAKKIILKIQQIMSKELK